MKLRTYLNYPGTAKEAFSFYEKNLGGKITMTMTHGDVPQPDGGDPAWKDKVLHSNLELGDINIMATDVPKAEPMRSAYLSLSLDSIPEAERVYKVLSDGGEVFIPLQETFFAHRFGQLRDKFGTSWMILHEKPMQ
jgi:PhnB protein